MFPLPSRRKVTACANESNRSLRSRVFEGAGLFLFALAAYWHDEALLRLIHESHGNSRLHFNLQKRSIRLEIFVLGQLLTFWFDNSRRKLEAGSVFLLVCDWRP